MGRRDKERIARVIAGDEAPVRHVGKVSFRSVMRRARTALEQKVIADAKAKEASARAAMEHMARKEGPVIVVNADDPVELAATLASLKKKVTHDKRGEK